MNSHEKLLANCPQAGRLCSLILNRSKISHSESCSLFDGSQFQESQISREFHNDESFIMIGTKTNAFVLKAVAASAQVQTSKPETERRQCTHKTDCVLHRAFGRLKTADRLQSKWMETVSLITGVAREKRGFDCISSFVICRRIVPIAIHTCIPPDLLLRTHLRC